MTDPAVIGDQARYTKVAKQHRELEPVVEKFREMRKLDGDIAGAKELMRDADEEEMREMAAAELPELEERRAAVQNEPKVLELPKDPDEEKHGISEVTAGPAEQARCRLGAD